MSGVKAPNGRLKDKVRINGAIEVHPEGSYYIEWREGGRRRRERAEREEAVDQARRKAIELSAVREGLIAAPEPEPAVQPKIPIGKAIDDYLHFVRAHRKPRTWLTYRFTLDTLLRAAYKKKYVEDATRQDVLDFMTYWPNAAGVYPGTLALRSGVDRGHCFRLPQETPPGDDSDFGASPEEALFRAAAQARVVCCSERGSGQTAYR